MIVFGAGKLPQVAGSLGKGMRNFKDGMDPNLIDDEEMATEEKKEAWLACRISCATNSAVLSIICDSR